MQIALAGVSESQEDYNKSLQSVTQFSKDFLIPIDDAISQYTRLKASVVGAGGSTEDTDKAFRGMAAAILATGGNVNDFNSALVATAQVFSKGKVSAEELRQQIGERLPGAFTIFADSMGISTQELDEMLERGEVRLSSFGDFTQDLFERYGKTSAVLGSAPEKAGQRLQVALTFAALKFGSFFQKVGAGFQDYLTDLVNFAIDNEKALKLTAAKFLAFGEQIVNTIKTAAKNMAGALKPFFDFAGRALSAMLSRFQQAQREIAVRGMGVDPRTIGRQVLEGYKVEQGIGGPGNMFLSMKDREEVRRRYVEALGTFLGETTFQQLTDKYLDMFEGFTPDKFGSGLRDTSTGLDGGADGGGAAAVEKTRADISPQVYEISLKIIAARKEENELRLAGLEADLARQKLAESDLQARESEIQLLNINLAEQENVVKILEDRANMQVEYIDREDETADAVAFTEKALSAAGKQIAKNLNAQKEFNKEMTETEKLTESIKQSIESNVAGAIEAAIFEAQSLNESLSNILRQVASLLIQFGTKSLFNALPFANGGVFAQNGVVPFARGGVVSKPTLFPFANGVGLMGEAGPEAIMPLRRGPSGRLGVEASGGVGNVVVNVDASGSAVQGDQPNAKALGSAIGAAVQAEIIKQKRPGGLLS
jgi:tape measure domain-containing protein